MTKKSVPISFDLSEIDDRLPLIIGEAPLKDGDQAFLLYKDDNSTEVVDATKFLLSLVYGEQAIATKTELELAYAALNREFELVNVFNTRQKEIPGGFDFDREAARYWLEAEMLAASKYRHKEGDTEKPLLYGRLVILMGRGGEVLAEVFAESTSRQHRRIALKLFKNKRKSDFHENVFIFDRVNSRVKIMSVICSVYHSVYPFRWEKTEHKIKAENMLRDIFRSRSRTGLLKSMIEKGFKTDNISYFCDFNEEDIEFLSQNGFTLPKT